MINAETGEKISKRRIKKRTMEILFEIEGIVDTVGDLGADIVNIFGQETNLKGVNVLELAESEIKLEIFIRTKIGYPIPRIAQMAQIKIKEDIEDYYKLKVSGVDITVVEIEF